MNKVWAVLGFVVFLLKWVNAFGYSNVTNIELLENYKYSDTAPEVGVKPLMINLTLIQGADTKGAVCLDGTLPGYHIHPGSGSGANSWVIQLEGGGWCNNIRTCVFRKTTRRGSSKFMEKAIPFTGILSNKTDENPDFYNWNRVKLRYCDGASFSGEGQDETIITRACTELGIKTIPSKRCLSLLLWMEERYETIYQRHPGFQKGARPLMALDNPFPMSLPENLVGERWSFVQLPYSAVREEVSSLDKNFVFGAGLDLDLLGLEITDKTMIPGLAVASSRAKPLAAWMNGLEVCSIEADIAKASLVLSVGISSRYVYATYKKTSETTIEAEA